MGLAIKETIVAGNLIFNKVTTKKKNRLKGGRKKKREGGTAGKRKEGIKG